MLLSLLSGCHHPDAVELPATTPTGHYVKTSAKRFSLPASSATSKKSKRKSVTIGMPSGFRHEFHLGRDVDSMAELWDLERWRAEIERRVKDAAAEHAAINAAAAEAEGEQQEEGANSCRRLRPKSTIKRKPVPALLAENDEPKAESTALPVFVEEPVSSIPFPCSESAPESYAGESSSSSSGHSLEESDAVSVVSSLPPITPSTSPRASTDYKYVDPEHLPPLIEIENASPILEEPAMDISNTLFPISKAASPVVILDDAASVVRDGDIHDVQDHDRLPPDGDIGMQALSEKFEKMLPSDNAPALLIASS